MPLYENDGQGEEIPLGSIPKGKILKRDETTGALIGVDPSAPGAHTHPESEITNLVTDLSGKVASSHGHAQSEVTGLTDALGGKCASNDSRLSDARTPTAHGHAESEVTNLVTDLAAKETPAGAQGKVDAHKDLTTGCHGNLLHDNSRANGKPVYALLANDTLAQNYSANSCTKLTVTAARTLTTTVPPAGCDAHTIILTSGTTSYTITFGTGFKPTGTLATGTTSGRVFVVHWISDGTNLYESGRTAAMVA